MHEHVERLSCVSLQSHMTLLAWTSEAGAIYTITLQEMGIGDWNRLRSRGESPDSAFASLHAESGMT